MQNLKIRVSIFINYFIFAILMNSVGAVVLQVQRYFSVNESQASYLDGFKDITIAVTSFFIASFLTKIGYKKSMLFALAILAAGCFILPTVNTFTAVKILLSLVGFCFGITKMCVYSIVGLITKSEKEHISLLSFLESFFMIGVLSGNFLFACFIDDRNPHSATWLKSYYVLGAFIIIAFLFLLFSSLDESIVKTAEVNRFGWNDFAEMFQLLIKPVLLSFIICAFIYVLIEQSIMNWLPTFNNKVLKIPSAYSVMLASILAAFTFLGRFFAGILMKKIAWLPALIVCLMCAATLVLLAIPAARKSVTDNITSWKEIPFAAYIFPMIGFFIAPVYPIVNSVILSSFPKWQHGKISGWIVIFSALGGTLGSLITGHIFHAFGGEKAFYFSLIPIACLIVALIIFNNRHKKTTVRK